ncbi:MAG: tetratricopeptide repeat protein [candidate division Zixibacteria bacterium]|nr:tetratricopeptide repeat protein [candidate division Zixibacteria bacterium]
MRRITFTLAVTCIAVMALLSIAEARFIIGLELNRGKKFFEKADYDSAENVFKEIIAHDSTNTLSWHYLGRILYEKGELDSSIVLLEYAAGQNPESPGYCYWLGMAYAQKALTSGLFKKASFAGKMKKIWMKAVELDPGNSMARLNLALFYTEAPGIAGGDPDKAKAQADTILQYYPDNFKAKCVYCRVLEKKEKWDKAEECYIERYKESPQDYIILRALGMYYIDRERYEDAEKIFRDYVNVYPDYTDSHYCLGYAYHKQNRYRDAKTHYEKALQLWPQYEEARDRLKEVNDELGD